jgi:alanine racemase
VTAPRGPERGWLELDLQAVRANAREALRVAEVPLCAVVKADAYGHGATEVARAARAGGASSVAVATPEEALRLRQAGLTGSLQLLGAVLPAELEPALEAGVEHTLQDPGELAVLRRAARAAERRLDVHLEVDSGMARHGVAPGEALPLLAAAREAPELRVVGLMTHLSSALGDPAVSREELRRFQGVVDAARAAGLLPGRVHAAASAGLFRFPEARHSQVRAGIALLGLDPEGALRAAGAALRPALSLHARVLRTRSLAPGEPAGYSARFVAARPTRLALVGLGYADGLPWGASAKGAQVLLRGRRCPLVGSIMMDYALVDVTDVPGEVLPGEQVTFFGRQGAETLPLEELARLGGSMPYALACGLGGRLRREVVGEELTLTGGFRRVA